MMTQSLTIEDIIPGYEKKMFQEKKEKIEEKKYIGKSLDHSIILTSPEINDEIVSNRVFETMIKTALSEITDALSKEFHGEIGYMVNISIARDYENPDWKVNEIEVKVPIDNPKYVLQLWDDISDRVWDKIGRIEENVKEIQEIEDNTMITFDLIE